MKYYPYQPLKKETLHNLKHLHRSDIIIVKEMLEERLRQILFSRDFQTIRLVDLTIPPSSLKALLNGGLHTVGDVLQYGLDEIGTLKGIGPKKEKKIKELIDKAVTRYMSGFTAKPGL
jgi:hypothetical protein